MAEKRVKTSELRAMPDADLTAQLLTLQQRLWEHRVKAKNGSLQQTHLLRVTRRQMARLQTLLQERT